MHIFTAKVGMKTNEVENFMFEECDRYIGKIVDAMIENECVEIISIETGEVVTLEELQRVRGILSGLPIIDIMY